ncbi:hypothetical protein, partial [Janthinobacterium sp. AD80]|uniref:hypothetical protein n=1 Tax=Janthinobacterium sp. AD80 TaxID=1528773 RepID=UPI001CA4D774
LNDHLKREPPASRSCKLVRCPTDGYIPLANGQAGQSDGLCDNSSRDIVSTPTTSFRKFLC